MINLNMWTWLYAERLIIDFLCFPLLRSRLLNKRTNAFQYTFIPKETAYFYFSIRFPNNSTYLLTLTPFDLHQVEFAQLYCSNKQFIRLKKKKCIFYKLHSRTQLCVSLKMVQCKILYLYYSNRSKAVSVLKDHRT